MFSAHAVALAGTGLSTIALALLAYDLAGDRAGAVLGTALALKMVAYVGLAPAFGAIAPRLPRRRLLVTLDVVRAGLIACMPFVTEIWEIYLLIFLLSSCSAGFTPTFQASIPDVLPDEAEYTRALSLSRLAYDLENLLSPALAAFALTLMSYDMLFATNALTFLVSAALVTSVALPSPKRRQHHEGFWSDMTFGLVAYLRTPRLRGLLALSLAASAGGAMVIVNTVVYVRQYLGGSASDTAIAFAATGAGSMVVALLLPRLLDRSSDRLFMLAGGLLLSVGLLLGLLGPGLAGALPIWFVLGVGSALVQTPAGRLLARSADEADRPALYAAQFALSHACWLVAYPVAGWVGAAFGVWTAFTVLAVVAFGATMGAVRLWPARDPLQIPHAHAPFLHVHEHVHDEHHQHQHEAWEGPEPHDHPHEHEEMNHTHRYVIDLHHMAWPK